jgi:hypothetical protein
MTTVRGLDAANALLEELAGDLEHDGVLGNVLLLAASQAQRYAAGVVHVDTGRLKNSLHASTNLQRAGNRLSASVTTNVEYAIYEHRRGGDHAFFERTRREEGPNIVRTVRNHIWQALQ